MLEGSTVVGEQQYLNWGAGDADVTEKEWQFTQYTEYNNTDTNQKTFNVQLYEEKGELILNNSNGQSYFTLMEVDNNPSGGGGGGTDTNDYVDAAALSGTDLVIGRTGALADITVDLSSLGGGGGTGTVTQIDTGNGLVGGPITTTGTISLDSVGITLSLIHI